jgi:hypothetical protein
MGVVLDVDIYSWGSRRDGCADRGRLDVVVMHRDSVDSRLSNETCT